MFARFLYLSTVQQRFQVWLSDESPYDPIHSRNRSIVDHNVRLPRVRWYTKQVLHVYVSDLITLTLSEYGVPCEILLLVYRFYPTINLGCMFPFCERKLKCFPLCWFGGIHRATTCGISPEMSILLRSRKIRICNREYYSTIHSHTH